MYKMLSLFIFLNIVVYSENLFVSNGTLKLKYSTKNNKIIDIMNLTNGEKYIDLIEEAIYYNDKLTYPLSSDVSYIENTGIIRVINNYTHEIKTEKYIYITDRRNLVYIENSIENPKYASFYVLYRIKPTEKMGQLKFKDQNYSFENFKFSLSNKKEIYFSSESGMRSLSFFPLGKNQIKEADKDIILFLNPNQRGKIIISPLKIDEDYFEHSVTDEVNFWKKWLKLTDKEQVNRSLITLKMLQNRNGSIFSFDIEMQKLKAEDMLYVAEALIEWKHYTDAKRILTYLLTAKKDNPNYEYLISNYEYDSAKNEISKEDRYGEIRSLYNTALFLSVFSQYVDKSADLDFFRVNKQEVDKSVYYFLLSKLKNGSIEEESGKRESGRYISAIETYSLVYKSLSRYLEILERKEKNVDYENDRKKLFDLKSEFEKKFVITEELISSIEIPETPKLNETYYLEKSIITDEEKFKIYIQNLIRKYWNDENLDLKDEIEFSRKLIDIDYKNTLRRTLSQLEEKIKEMNDLLLNKYNEIDVEATSRYLILKANLEEQ